MANPKSVFLVIEADPNGSFSPRPIMSCASRSTAEAYIKRLPDGLYRIKEIQFIDAGDLA